MSALCLQGNKVSAPPFGPSGTTRGDSLSSRESRYPVTPDGHYFLVRGRLWRCTNPHLAPEARREHVRALMAARRAVRAAKSRDDSAALRAARQRVDAAKCALGERGPPWWGDDDPCCDRRRVENTSYRRWAASLPPEVRGCS